MFFLFFLFFFFACDMSFPSPSVRLFVCLSVVGMARPLREQILMFVLSLSFVSPSVRLSVSSGHGQAFAGTDPDACRVVCRCLICAV